MTDTNETTIDTSTTPRNMSLEEVAAYVQAIREENTIKLTDEMSHLEIAKACASAVFNKNPIRDERGGAKKEPKQKDTGRMVWLSKFNDQAQDGNPIFNPYSMKPVQTYTRSIGRNFIKRQARAMVDRFRGTENPISYSQAKAVLNKELERIKKEQEERDDS